MSNNVEGNLEDPPAEGEHAPKKGPLEQKAREPAAKDPADENHEVQAKTNDKPAETNEVPANAMETNETNEMQERNDRNEEKDRNETNDKNDKDGKSANDETRPCSSSDTAIQGPSSAEQSFATKFLETKNKMPGPGSYRNTSADFNSRHRTVPSFGFGTNTRQIRHINKTPGPGSYDAKQGHQGSGRIGADAKISCTPRRDAPRSRQKAPGPGAYNLPDAFGRGKLTITPRKDQTLPRLSVPGPGDYEVAVSTAEKFMKFRAPKFSFGTARQRARLPAEFEAVTPGPGAYRTHPELPHDPASLRSRK